MKTVKTHGRNGAVKAAKNTKANQPPMVSIMEGALMRFKALPESERDKMYAKMKGPSPLKFEKLTCRQVVDSVQKLQAEFPYGQPYCGEWLSVAHFGEFGRTEKLINQQPAGLSAN
jgi:hypothetical protein